MIYRSFRVVYQNSTNQPLVIGGYSTVRGVWSEDLGPEEYGVIFPNQSAAFQTQSEEVGVGTEAYLRLGSTFGWVSTAWNRPWTGQPTVEVDFESAEAAEHLGIEISIDQEEPMYPTAIFRILSKKSSERLLLRDGDLHDAELLKADLESEPEPARRSVRRTRARTGKTAEAAPGEELGNESELLK